MAGLPPMLNNFLTYVDTETSYPIHLYAQYIDRIHMFLGMRSCDYHVIFM